MEYRKLIGFGKSSFVVSIPKDWIERHHLTKGASVALSEENESIIISPAPLAKNRAQETRTITTDGKSDKLLQREIVSAYIAGSSTIIITGSDLRTRRTMLTESFDTLIALEVVKQDDESIIAKDFLDIEDIELKDLVRRIDNNIRSMFLETIELLDDPKNTALVDHIRERDDSVNKLAFLSFRSIRELLNNPSKTRESMIDLFHTWTTVLYLERSGDELKRAGRIVSDAKLSAEQAASVKRSVEALYALYKRGLTTYYESSTNKEKAYLISEECRDFQRETKSAMERSEPHLVQASERLINLASHLEEILRLTYDFL
jgi:phosphate uptake regulator